MGDQYSRQQKLSKTNVSFFVVPGGNNVNEPPILEAGGYPTGLPLSESTKVGTEVFVLKGHDPEGSPVKYGIQLTDHFVVDPRTGVITLAKPLNREVKHSTWRDWRPYRSESLHANCKSLFERQISTRGTLRYCVLQYFTRDFTDIVYLSQFFFICISS